MPWSRESRFRSPTRLDGRLVESPSPGSHTTPAVWVPVKVQTSPTRMRSPKDAPEPVPVAILPPPVQLPPAQPVVCGNCSCLQMQLDDATEQLQMLRRELVNTQAQLILQHPKQDQADLERYKQDAERYSQETERYKQEAERCKQEADHCEQEAIHYKQEAERYKQEASQSQARLQQREVEWSDEWSSKENSLMDKHDQEIQKLAIELEDAESNIAHLQEKNKSLEAVISKSMTQEGTNSSRVDDSQLAALRTQCEAAERQVESLTLEKEEMNRTLMLLRTNLQKAEFQLQDAPGDDNPLAGQMEELNEELKSRSETLSSVRRDADKLRAELDKARRSSASLDTDNQRQLDELHTALDAALKQNGDHEAQNKELQIALEASKKTRSQRENEQQVRIKELQAALETAKKTGTQLESEHQAQEKELREELRALRLELDTAADAAVRANRNKSSDDSEIQRLENSIETFRKKLENATDSEDKLRSANNRLQTEIERVKDDCMMAQGELRRVTSLREQEKAGYEEGLIQAVNRAKDMSGHEVEALNEKIAGLNRLLEEAKEELTALKARHDATVEQLKTSSAVERARLQEKLASATAQIDEETLTSSKLESNVSKLTLELQGAQEELSRLTTLYGRSLEALEEDRARHKASMKDLSSGLEEERARKDGQIADLKRQLQIVNEDMENKANELRLVQVKISGKIDEADAVHAEYKRQLQQAADKAHVQDLENQQLVKKTAEQDEELRKWREEHTRLREESLLYTSTMDTCTRERDQAVDNAATLENELVGLRAQHKKQGTEHADETGNLRATNSRLNTELDTTTRQLQALEEETDKRVAQLKERIAAAEEANSEKTQQAMQLKCTVEMLEMEKSRLENQMKNKTVEHEAMESRLARLKEAAAQAVQFEDTFDSLNAEKQRMETTIENLTIDLEDSNRAFKRLKVRFEGDTTTQDELKAQLNGLKKQLADAKSDIMNLQDVADRQKKVIAELKDMENEVLLRHSSSVANLKKADTALNSQTGELSSLKARLSRAQDNEQETLEKLRLFSIEHTALTEKHEELKAGNDEKMEARVKDLTATLAEKEREAVEKIDLLKQKEDTLQKIEEEVVKQKEEIEFIVFTRAELVQSIMDLRKAVKESVKETHRCFAKDPIYKRALAQSTGSGVMKISSGYMTESVRSVKHHLDISMERVNTIAGKYLTDYEKMHHGSSPQHFSQKHDDSLNLFDKLVKRKASSSAGGSPRSRTSSPRANSPRRSVLHVDTVGPLVLQHPKESPMATDPSSHESPLLKDADEGFINVEVLPQDLKKGIVGTKELGTRLQKGARLSETSQRQGPKPRATSRSRTSTSSLLASAVYGRSTTPKGTGTGGGPGARYSATPSGSSSGLKFIDSSTPKNIRKHY
eukprot:TRINITY_DN3308_c0_g5_i1.p1 TRINITY_DN3308_c0_g5~~TRINITY_DN3308_c0_g5_i1.p1  ORF type:complete len:1394 (+),score=398.22 TRINITY_DN3308_c0_g5_i1:36-4217(+)